MIAHLVCSRTEGISLRPLATIFTDLWELCKRTFRTYPDLCSSKPSDVKRGNFVGEIVCQGAAKR